MRNQGYTKSGISPVQLLVNKQIFIGRHSYLFFDNQYPGKVFIYVDVDYVFSYRYERFLNPSSATDYGVEMVSPPQSPSL
jgi:hypothetical protein